MLQIVQVAGAILVLTAFVLARFRILSPKAPSYLALNAAGGIVLAILALIERQWGFLLLQSAWAMISLWGLRSLRERAANPRSR